MNSCKNCNKTFSQKSSLSRHIKTSKKCNNIVTIKEKTLKVCDKCNKVLSTKQRLISHIKICKEVSINIQEDNLVEIKEYKFGNTNFIVPIRLDGMINATALCKAGNKRLDNYKRSASEFLKTLKNSLPQIEDAKFINIVEGGNYKNQGTWVHRKIGYHLAQWISNDFAVKVSTILDELFITGKVELDKEKSNEEIEVLYKQQIKNLTSELETNKEQYHLLLKKHNSSLKNHRYIKFKKTDPCFYIIDSGIIYDSNIQFKFGIAGTDEKNTIDDRLESHRTLWPLLKVRFLLFMKDVTMIEKSFKMMYEKEINPNGHEIIEGISLKNMIDRLKQLFDLLCLTNYHIMSDEKLKEYNDYVDTTVKSK